MNSSTSKQPFLTAWAFATAVLVHTSVVPATDETGKANESKTTVVFEGGGDPRYAHIFQRDKAMVAIVMNGTVVMRGIRPDAQAKSRAFLVFAEAYEAALSGNLAANGISVSMASPALDGIRDTVTVGFRRVIPGDTHLDEVAEVERIRPSALAIYDLGNGRRGAGTSQIIMVKYCQVTEDGLQQLWPTGSVHEWIFLERVHDWIGFQVN